MLLKLEMPQVSRMVDACTVDRWLCTTGDVVSPGDDLVQLKVEEITRMKHTNPQRLFRRSRRHQAETTSFREVSYLVRVTAVDRGVLRGIAASPGARVRLGTLLAVLSTGEGDPEPGAVDPSALSTFRVVANTVEEDPK